MSRRMVASAAFAAVLLTASAAAAQNPLDRLGRLRAGAQVAASLAPIGTAKEVEIGRGIAATVAGRYRLVRDEELTRYVEMVGAAVAQHSPRDGELTFRFGVLDSDDVNAFAAPGGYVFVTRGALRMMESEAELAGVLGHEVAHVDQKHVLEEIRKGEAARGLSDQAQISGPVLEAVRDFGSQVVFRGFSRGDEAESDSLAILYAAAAGYRPDGLARFLERLAATEQAPAGAAGARLREWVSTHPPSAERLVDVRRQLAARPDAESGQAVEERFRRRTASIRAAPPTR